MSSIDLHSHSTASDGILSPAALVSRASEHGVTTLALTDHDTTAGLDEARVRAQELNITLIPGIELSGLWRGQGIHIVGLCIDPGHEAMIRAVEQQRAARQQRAQTIAEGLARVGCGEVLEDAIAEAGGDNVGRVHFARVLVKKGLVADVNKAFKRYLGSGKVGDVRQCWPPMEEVITWIKASGGLAILAHPDKYKLTRTRQRNLLDAFAAAGGSGLEVISGRQKPGMADYLARIGHERDLYASCGSDFHICDAPWQELGAFEAMPVGIRPIWESPLWTVAV